MMPQIAYLSFDRVPAPKGAAVHIAAFARALGQAFAPVTLLTLAPAMPPGPPGQPAPPAPPRSWRTPPRPRPFAPGVSHVCFEATGRHLIESALDFRTQMRAWWQQRTVPVAHVRSIFEGYPLARGKGALCRRLVYEVNGLPSIELKYHYPAVADDRELLAKLRAQEQACLDAADLVVTPSQVTAGHLADRGVARERLHVIPNGVDLDVFTYRAPRPWGEWPVRMLYAGTLTSWQGLHHAIEALQLYRRDAPATLTVVGPARTRQRRQILDRCRSLGLGDAITLIEPVPQDALAALHHEHDVVVIPLPANDRNLVQGCCPLKLLEAMATGTPIIASDMPVVRDLAAPDREALLVKPGSAKAIKDAMLRLRAEPALGPRLGQAARRRVARDYTWAASGARLIHAYESVLGIKRASTRASEAASTSP